MKMKPIAVAVAAALPISALAATLADHTGNDVSAEFVALNKVVSGIAPSVTLGASYSAGDIITFTFNQAPKLAASGVSVAADATKAYSWPLTETIDNGGAGIGTLGLVSSTDTSVSYRVATITQNLGATPPVLGSITLPSDVRFFPAGDVTYTTASSTANGTAIDPGKTAAGASSTILYDIGPSQFAATVGGLSKVVDVTEARKEFTTGTTHQVTVAISYTVGSPSAAYAVEPRTATLVLDGDFSWIDTSTATTATGVQGGVTVSTGDGTAAVGIDGTRITITGIPAIADGTAGAGSVITLTNSLKQVIPLQTISASVTGLYNSGTVASATTTATTNVTSSATASGAYTLNGSTVTVFAVPTSSAVSNFIWLSNTGKTDGDVSITVYDGGTTHELGVVGTSKGGTEFDVTAALNAGLEAKGITLSGGRVHMDILTNAPGKDIAVSAAYRVGDDRVNLVTSLEAPRS